MSDLSKLNKEIYDETWDAWDDMKQYGPMSRHTRRLVWKMIRDLSFESLLDVGCGQGSTLEQMHRRRPSVQLTGVDISERGIELARMRTPKARFHVLDLTKQALSERYDLIVCTDVLEHVPEDEMALANMRRMCAHWCLVSSIQGHMRPYENVVGHVRNYRRGELRRKMERAGFHVVQQIDWGFPFYSPLYRDLLRFSPPSAVQGHYGTGRKLLSSLLYQLFTANLSRWGDYVFCLAEVES